MAGTPITYKYKVNDHLQKGKTFCILVSILQKHVFAQQIKAEVASQGLHNATLVLFF